MRRAGPGLAALALALLAPCAPAATVSFGGEFATGYDSNVGNSGAPNDRRPSASRHIGTSANWEERFGLYTALQLRSSVAVEQLLELESLSNVRAAVRLRVLRKPGRSFHTPVLGGWLAAGVRRSASDIRSGYDYRAGVSAAAPVTTAVEVRLEALASRRAASSGRVFDLSSVSYGLNVDWLAAPRLIVYGGVRVDEGDFTVTAQGEGIVEPKTEHLYLEPRARAIEADPAFGQDWWAFGVDGRTVVGTVGFNVPLSRTLALDLQLQRGEANLDRFSYVRGVGSLGLLVRW